VYKQEMFLTIIQLQVLKYVHLYLLHIVIVNRKPAVDTGTYK